MQEQALWAMERVPVELVKAAEQEALAQGVAQAELAQASAQ